MDTSLIFDQVCTDAYGKMAKVYSIITCVKIRNDKIAFRTQSQLKKNVLIGHQVWILLQLFSIVGIENGDAEFTS